MKRIAVVSDTHGHTGNTLRAVEAIRAAGVEAVLHCGDIGSTEIVALFADWPTHFVFGNVDFDGETLEASIVAAGQTCHGRFGDLTLGGVRIALLHSDDVRRFYEVTHSGDFQLVCYGHTHVAKQHHVGSTLVLNPGALYRATPHSFAIVELPELKVSMVPLS